MEGPILEEGDQGGEGPILEEGGQGALIWRRGVTGVDPGFSEGGGGGGGANNGKGEWGVPPPTQSREAFAIIVCN